MGGRGGGNALWGEIKEDIKERLEPIQMGVGTSMGAETIVHSVREWLERHGGDEDSVLGMLDLSNAFNEIERSAFRKAVREMMPCLPHGWPLSWKCIGPNDGREETTLQERHAARRPYGACTFRDGQPEGNRESDREDET